MAEEKQEVAKINPLKQLSQEIEAAASIRDVMLIAQDRWVKNYSLVTGKKDGEQRFQSEFLNYLDIVNEKPDLQKADKFSHFAAVMKAAVTGLSFRSEGHLYPILYGNKVKVQIGAHGKREMLRMMPDIKFLHEGQVVMKGDHFVYDKMNSKIKEHYSTKESSTSNSINDVVGSYVRLEFQDGRIIDVYVSKEEILRAKSKSKNQGESSVWEQWPLEMAKKVPYHRAKKLYHRYPDGTLDFGGEASGGSSDDGDDTIDTPYSEETTISQQEPEFVKAEEVKNEDVKKTTRKREVPDI